jgi:hypothetical protein
MNIRKIAVNTLKYKEEKNFLNEFSHSLSPIYDSIFKKTYVYPLTEEKNIEILIKTASELNIKYPKGKIISLGQSPAWTVAAASLMTEDLMKYDGIAFSGAFYV